MTAKKQAEKQPFGFEISTSASYSGKVVAAYIYFSQKRVARTKVVKQGAILMDLDRAGEIIGLEILAPVKVADLVRLVPPTRRPSFEKFIRQAAPPRLIRG